MASRGRVLIIDDDAETRTELAALLRACGYVADTAADGFKALHKLSESPADVVITDLVMPGIDGLGLMRKAVQVSPCAIFVVVADRPSIDDAVRAVRGGAVDVLVKPVDAGRLRATVERAMVQAQTEQQRMGMRVPVVDDPAFTNVIGEHPSMVSLLNLVRQIAPSRASVLLEGESGTGKGLIAQAIHRASLRAERPFVRLSCAELTPSLLESEIFGHEKGAFTGAVARREGRFKQADGGTLFLDEVSEVPGPTQVKLLRFMQERTFERVGGNETQHVDVRIISASNKPLKHCVEEGSFRLDLYYRLNVVPLHLPALRERSSDIPLLAGHFLRRFARENGRDATAFSDEALAMLQGYDWPGNVRELENVIERAVVLCEGPRIEAWHLPAHLNDARASGQEPRVPGSTIYDLERWAILKTLEACGGSTSRAALILGISARKIQYKLHEYDEARGREPGHHSDSNSLAAEDDGS